ncbi:MAG: ABC transporter substrate-binding protein [Ruminococcus sp.]|jgi:oligopeptide transport system substrate-binding protein|nr:ABC transporter substrate-binding protein [Ruminococcus sp.]
MKILQKLFTVFFILTVVLTALSGCRDSGSGRNYEFTLNLASNPGNLDPQLAADSASIEIIKNTFRGLMKRNGDGSVTPDLAESFTMSDDGKKFTFVLRENVFWLSQNEFTASVSAEDFVYAFRRMFNSASSSPYPEDFLCIKNAEKIINGDVSFAKIGVTAVDEMTVEFELEYPYAGFLELLTHTAALPCNEEFFVSTKGRYGLDPGTSISNGAFFVDDWNYDPYWHENFIHLSKNKLNYQPAYLTEEGVEIAAVYDILPSGIHYDIKSENEDSADFAEGDIEAFKLFDYDKKELAGKTFIAAQTKTYALIANPESEISDPNLVQALGIFTKNFEFESELIDGKTLERATALIPKAVMVSGKSYRNMVSDASVLDANTNPQIMWQSAMESYPDGLGDVKITISENFPDSSLIYSLTDSWRETFGTNFLVEIVSSEEYKIKKESQSYDMILAEISSEKNDVKNYFDIFTTDDNSITANLLLSETAASLNDMVGYIKNAETIAVSSGKIIPLFYGYEYCIINENADGIEYIPFSKELIMRKAEMF